jgi:hypothetical protein
MIQISENKNHSIFLFFLNFRLSLNVSFEAVPCGRQKQKQKLYESVQFLFFTAFLAPCGHWTSKTKTKTVRSLHFLLIHFWLSKKSKTRPRFWLSNLVVKNEICTLDKRTACISASYFHFRRYRYCNYSHLLSDWMKLFASEKCSELYTNFFLDFWFLINHLSNFMNSCLLKDLCFCSRFRIYPSVLAS